MRVETDTKMVGRWSRGWGRSMQEAGEIAHRLRALIALAEDPSPVLSTHLVAHNHQEPQFQGIQCFLLISVGTRHAYSTNPNMQAKHYMHTMK